jgi:hypothetical protein
MTEVVGRKLLSRPKRSRNEAVEPYEEEVILERDNRLHSFRCLLNIIFDTTRTA